MPGTRKKRTRRARGHAPDRRSYQGQRRCQRCFERHRQPTDKQIRFVQEYLIDLDAPAAAVRAGYGYQDTPQKAHTILRSPAVTCALIRWRARQEKRTAITADRVLGALLRIAEFDLGVLFDSKGNMRPVQSLPIAARRALAAIEMIEEVKDGSNGTGLRTRTHRVKVPDKIRALELLGRHLKLFTEVHRVETQQTLRVRIDLARERIAGGSGALLEGEAERLALPEVDSEGVAHG